MTNSEDFEDKRKVHQKKGSKIVGSNHNTLKEVPIKTHALPQQRSTLVRKKHEGEKNGEYGEVEVEP